MAGYGILAKKSERGPSSRKPNLPTCGRCGEVVNRNFLICNECKQEIANASFNKTNQTTENK